MMSWVGCLLTDSGLPDTWNLRGWEYLTEILRRIWLYSANKIKNSESGSKQSTQLIIAENNCHTHYIILVKDMNITSGIRIIFDQRPKLH